MREKMEDGGTEKWGGTKREVQYKGDEHDMHGKEHHKTQRCEAEASGHTSTSRKRWTDIFTTPPIPPVILKSNWDVREMHGYVGAAWHE